MEMGNVITMENVSWKRDGKSILSHIDWEVSKGEHWALLGRNGSGKTALLNLINGYIWPTSGKIKVLEKVFGKTDIRELRKSIGWVSSSLQERMKGNELAEDIIISGSYATIGLYENPTEKVYQKALQIMDMLGCEQLVGRPYQTCSQGEKQKILIGRGLMSSPKLLILDEPMNGLDFIAREELLTAINQFADQIDAPTMIYVTHHIDEISPIFTKTLLLRNGTIFDQGKSKEMLTSEQLSRFFERNLEVQWDY